VVKINAKHLRSKKERREFSKTGRIGVRSAQAAVHIGARSKEPVAHTLDKFVVKVNRRMALFHY
jgi:uncharacterized protein (DUF111 family)